MPWKLVPYPTLVGTAITGQLTSPPTTLRQCSFHARHDDEDIGLLKLGHAAEEPVQAGHADVARSAPSAGP